MGLYGGAADIVSGPRPVSRPKTVAERRESVGLARNRHSSPASILCDEVIELVDHEPDLVISAAAARAGLGSRHKRCRCSQHVAWPVVGDLISCHPPDLSWRSADEAQSGEG